MLSCNFSFEFTFGAWFVRAGHSVPDEPADYVIVGIALPSQLLKLAFRSTPDLDSCDLGQLQVYSCYSCYKLALISVVTIPQTQQ